MNRYLLPLLFGFLLAAQPPTPKPPPAAHEPPTAPVRGPVPPRLRAHSADAIKRHAELRRKPANAPQPMRAMKYNTGQGQTTSRLVSGDPNRSTLLVYTSKHTLYGDFGDTRKYVVTGPNGYRAEVPRVQVVSDQLWWHYPFYGAIQIPAGLKAGDYSLDAGSGTPFAFTVEIAPKDRNTTTLQPGASAGDVTKEFGKGNDVILAPGRYDWNTDVVLPSEARTIYADGAYVYRHDNGDVNDYGQRFFWKGRDLTIEGGTWTHTGQRPNNNLVFHAGPWSEGTGTETTGYGFVIKNATFRDCVVGWGLYESWFSRIEFVRASAVTAPTGWWDRCTWTGKGPDQEWDCWGSLGATAMTACTFNGTMRGPVGLTSAGGPIDDNLFVTIRLLNIGPTENGEESFMVEPTAPDQGSFSRNVILNVRSAGGRGNVFQLDCPSRDNFVHNMQNWTGQTLLWASYGENTGNTLQDCEFHGPVVFGARAKNNTIYNSGFHWHGPTRDNQGGYALPYYDGWRASVNAVGPDAATNVISGGRFYIQQPLTAALGVKLTDCLLYGQPMN